MIILKYKDLINNKDNINKLIKLLKNDGVIIIENIGRNFKGVLKIYFNTFRHVGIEILDFRLKRFILNNSILLIRRQNNKNIFKKLKELFLLFQFLINESMISLLLIIFKKWTRIINMYINKSISIVAISDIKLNETIYALTKSSEDLNPKKSFLFTCWSMN